MTSGHVRPEPWPPMWRVVERVVQLGPPEDAVTGTLLSSSSSSSSSSSAAAGAIATSQQQQQLGPPLHNHHHHWAAHQHYLPPPPPPPLHPLALPPAVVSSSSSSPVASSSSSSTSSSAGAAGAPSSHGYPHEQQEHQQQQSNVVTQDTSPSQQHHHQRSSVKRPMSDSDCDDVFSEESGKEPCNSPGGDSWQHTSRKRRRGMIEKKRRDRINASLGELRRLVPAAARDPHSGKLEKAEILQLTVEHLRTLKNKGVEGYDSSKLAMDYHAVGWGECAAEVGRYLVTMEGFDERNPLRLRLLSHLQSFQRAAEQQQPPPPPTQSQQHPHAPHHIHGQHHQSPYPPGTEIGPAGPLAAPWPPAQYSAQYPAQYGQQQHGKPYRPWGAELAY
ncbi:LOW QUALITY PROTEIN: hairy/enhancer-of-split related with YRPW motif protein-like [Copidosoma floridanum]|uniref:LOW QUALITY PROTEIN: hairy/enhancer-of-split related with YRPW motif protein-like n=1 Tax=Copidosoma floridanum TaxID=29053 RepID=UPI0006C97B35|nr:LOW QUALITY PROTEIN: hairy/enhancer-of-split related with YRPW motif protein-like [Copidosoma floridanum]